MANLRVDKITSTETFETTGSVQFDGDDYLEFAQNTDLSFGTGDYTVECWIYPQLTTGNLEIVLNTGGKDAQTFYFHYDNDQLSVGNQNAFVSRQTGLEFKNTWYHVAACRFNGVLKLFKDGKQVGNDEVDGTDWASGGTMRIGLNSDGAQGVFGNISNLRVLKGKAIYTENFKPPMKELEVTPETVLLACQSKTDATLEKTGKTLTASGAVASELTPGILTPIVKSGGGSAITGSVEFDGTADYLGLPTTTDFTFGTNDFTIEFWLNPGENASNYTILLALTSSTASDRFEVAYHSSTIQVYTDTATWRDTGITPSKGDWHHIAFVRNYSGNSLIMYINGVNRWEVTNTRDYDELFTSAKIGSYADSSYGYLQGFISNFRINKNTALYTDSFIPPTRELKRVPGTVLLCCQDPNNPLTEATGKTITGYGSLNQLYGTELAINGQFTADSDWTKGDQWTISGNSASITDSPNRTSDSFLTQDGSSWIHPGQMYRVAVDWSITTGDFDVRIGGNANLAKYSISSYYSSPYYFDIEAGATNTNLEIIANQHMVGSINSIHVDYAPPSKAGSNFTPQVGDDRKVTFEGVTKINTENYFYLPTGDTESRDNGAGTRGVFVRGQSDTPSSTLVNTIEYINISSTGNAINFGDAAVQSGTAGACSDSTRGLQGGGQIDGGTTADILRFTIASTGTAVDSGADLLSAGSYIEALSSSTRAVFVGGSPPGSNVLQFTEIQSLGNTVDFGNLNNNVFGEGTCCDGVRGVIFGGTTGPSPGDRIDSIDYIIVSSKGDAQDFGNLGAARAQGSGFSNKIRGIYAGGRYQPQNNIIEYVTIATTGNANDFGDLISQASRDGGGTCSSTRGVHAGGDANPSPTADVNTIQYITIMSMGNALDFGDLTERKTHIGACSNGHGGLG